jgi:hypothetical protein
LRIDDVIAAKPDKKGNMNNMGSMPGNLGGLM